MVRTRVSALMSAERPPCTRYRSFNGFEHNLRRTAVVQAEKVYSLNMHVRDLSQNNHSIHSQSSQRFSLLNVSRKTSFKSKRVDGYRYH